MQPASSVLPDETPHPPGSSGGARRDPIPALIKRNVLLLAASQALVGTATQMMPALGAIMAVHFTGSAVLAGLATAVLAGCRFLVAYPAGYLADTRGRRVVLLIGLLLA